VSMPEEPEDRDSFFHLFTADEARCPACGHDAVISQWRGRHIERLDGFHLLAMRDRRCPVVTCAGRSTIFRPVDEHRFALKKDVYGLDVMFEIAERRLQDDLSFEEITRRLNARGVPITLKTTCESFKRFVALTSCCAGESEEVRQKLRAQGGIVPMIDGVQFDDRSPVLYLVVDTISRTPLFAERHAVRSAEGLKPLLKRLKAMGVPILAFVTDMEKGLVPAIRAVFPEVPHQFCQLHFLKRCAAGLDKPLAALGAEVDRAAEKVRRLRRDLKKAPAPATAEEAFDRKLVDDLLVSAHAATKRAGRAPSKPTALFRNDELAAVAKAVDEVVALRGGARIGKDHISPGPDGAPNRARQRAPRQRRRPRSSV
jgi:hypothetical protein